MATANDDLAGSSMIVAPVPAEQRAAAVRHVASRATDAEDCALLLDMLGLSPHECLVEVQS